MYLQPQTVHQHRLTEITELNAVIRTEHQTETETKKRYCLHSKREGSIFCTKLV